MSVAVCCHFEGIGEHERHPNCQLGEPINCCGPDCELYRPDSDRQPCEIWTRVMGYHRPVSAFNQGKAQEHSDRKFFREDIHD